MWCEAWMRRDDLPQGYDGWQVLDATSQDRQSGCYRIGPASVLAIKNGQSGKQWPHDVEYVISQINADIAYHRVATNFSTTSHQSVSLAKVCRGEVGTCLVTSAYIKEEDYYKPLDVTDNYRNHPISADPDAKLNLPLPPTRDCCFNLSLCGAVNLGEDIRVTISVTNKGAMLRTVDGRVVGTIIYYTGQSVRTFMSMDFSGLVSPGQSESTSCCMYI